MAVIYLPVDTPEMRAFAADWNDGRAAKGKHRHQIIRCRGTGAGKAIRRVGFGALRNVGAATKVYILTHGIKSGAGVMPASWVGARRGGHQQYHRGVPRWVGGQLKQFTPDQLARHVDREGLSHAIQDLRLFSCGAGVDVDNNTRSFGHRFREALRARGYANVRLTAYTGNLQSAYATRSVTPGYTASTAAPHLTEHLYKGVQLGGTYYPASSRRVYFN
jgi:hypothetical protein